MDNRSFLYYLSQFSIRMGWKVAASGKQSSEMVLRFHAVDIRISSLCDDPYECFSGIPIKKSVRFLEFFPESAIFPEISCCLSQARSSRK